MVILSFGQVVARNLFSTGFIWVDHVLRLEVLWVAFIGAAHATEYHQHIKIDFIASITRSDFSKQLITAGAHMFAFIICCLLFIVSSYYIRIVSSDITSTVIQGIPDWSFQLIVPYCFFFAALRFLISIIKISNEKDSKLKHLS
jgi:TRAP-type C4-dicarboxylate transport system permease small subunit